MACNTRGLPVKIFVARPKDASDPDYPRNIKRLKQAGVGLLEIDGESVSIIQNALALSLAAQRPVDLESFPKKYRQSLSQAEQAYRDGYPDKACSLVYDELENYFRKVAKKSFDKHWWPNSSNLNIDTGAWAKLIADFDANVNRGIFPCRELKPALLATLLGVTRHRNESGHKPENQKKLIKRDKELRTRFESAVDIYRDILTATKLLKI